LLRRHSSASIPVHSCVHLIWEMNTAPGELKANVASVAIATAMVIAMTMAIAVIVTDDLLQAESIWGQIFLAP
jgi:hypothetical protein